MNLNFTAEFSRQDIERLVRESMAKAMPGHEVEHVEFNVNASYDWRGEATGHTLSSVKVKLKLKEQSKRFATSFTAAENLPPFPRGERP